MEIPKAGRPKVIIMGPGPTQVGGVATFVGILFSSTNLQEKFELIHLDTTRGKIGAGVASRFAPINLIYFVRQVIRFFWLSLRYRPQIIHLPVTSFWAFWKDAAFILLARILGMKIVAHLHGGLFDQYYRNSSPLGRHLIGWVMRRTDIVIALSNRWKHFLLEEVRPDLTVEVVPNTVDFMFANAINKSGHISRDKDFVLFLGSLGHRKGVYDILKAVPLVLDLRPNTSFVFAGKEETKGEWAKIEKVCQENRLNDKVTFLGEVIGENKVNLYQKSTLFLLPSYGENLPYGLLEAMAVGLPVITTPVGAIPEIVEEGKNGYLIKPGDYQALANRILLLLENPSIQTSMSIANIEKIKDEYLPDIAVSRFDRIYSKLLSKSLRGDLSGSRNIAKKNRSY